MHRVEPKLRACATSGIAWVTLITDSCCVLMVTSIGSAPLNMSTLDAEGMTPLLDMGSVLDCVVDTLTELPCGPSAVGVHTANAPFERVFSTSADILIGFFSPKVLTETWLSSLSRNSLKHLEQRFMVAGQPKKPQLLAQRRGASGCLQPVWSWSLSWAIEEMKGKRRSYKLVARELQWGSLQEMSGVAMAVEALSKHTDANEEEARALSKQREREGGLERRL